MGNYHEWGDKDFDWDALYKAEKIIRKVCRLFRIGIHSKEKYGTLRASVYPFRGSLHDLAYPGYVYSQFPDWLWKFDCLKINPFMNGFPMKYVTWTIQLFQLHVGYRLAYYIAMKKYQHIAEEICVDADYPEYIIGGQEIHDKYWSKCE